MRFADIPGYEGLYRVSDEGDVYTVATVKNTAHTPARTFSVRARKRIQTVDRLGYKTVILYGRLRPKHFLVHRLVMASFHPDADHSLDVNHKNGVKSDNRIENLEWVTKSGNQTHSYQVLSRQQKKGCDNPRSHAVVGMDRLTGKILIRLNSYNEAKNHGLSPGTINNCVRGRQKSYKGLIWMRAQDAG